MVIETKKIHINKKDLWNFFLLGVFSQTAIAIVFYSLKYTTVLDNAIITILGTILIVFAGHYFYREKVDQKLKIGLILASIGTLIVILEPALTGDHGNSIEITKRLWGNVLAMLYNVTWVIYIVWSKMSMGQSSPMLKKTLSFIHIKPMHHPYPPTFIAAVTFYVGLATLIPLALWENLSEHQTYFNINNLGIEAIWGILYMAILSSIVAYMLNQWALETGKIRDAAVFSYIGIVFSFPIAFLLLGEVPNTYMIIGGAIIAFGVFIAELKNS
jgi:drug/metabolite transporter (DMT)-like permease